MVDRLIERFRSSSIAQGGLAFFVASIGLSLSNFIFHIVISRLLGPSNYGALGALLNVVLLLAVPLGAVQAIITRTEAACNNGKSQGIGVRAAVIRSFLVGAIFTVLFIALAPFLTSYLHLSSIWFVVISSGWILPALIGAILQGVLMGRLRFRPVSVAMILGGGIARLGFGVALVEMGFGLQGAIAATVLSQIVATSILFFPLISEFIHSKKQSVGIGFKGSILTLTALVGYWVIATEDTVLARHFLSAHDAGWYAAAATAGRIALFLPGAIALIAFPKFSQDKGRGELARQTLRWSLAITALLGLSTALVLLVIPSFVVSILFGSNYLGAVGAVMILGFEAAGLGMAALLTYFHLARESYNALYGWLGAAIAFIGINIFHHSITQIAFVMLISIGVVVIVLFITAVNGLLNDPSFGDFSRPRKEDFAKLEGDPCGLSLVIPYYNPGPSLVKHVLEISEILEQSGINYEILTVSDGSTDGSPRSLDGLLPSILRNIEMLRNHGKGQALRVGLSQSRGKYLGFIDADGDIPAFQLLQFIDTIKKFQPDIISASKRHPDSEVFYSPVRRLYSWGYQQITRTLFRLSIRDTQTGIKFIRREVLSDVLPLMVEKRFAFDLELFVVAKHLGYRKIIELPVHIQRRFTSSISLKAVKGIFLDTLGIFYRLYILRYYDSAQEPSDSGLQSTNPPVAGSKMRILICNWRDLKHPRAGGAEVYTDAVATEWVKMGHSVTLFCSRVEGEPEQEVTPDGYKIIRRGSRHGVYREAKRFWRKEGIGNFDLVIDEVNTRPFSCSKFITQTPIVALIHQVAREVWFYETSWIVAILGRYVLEPLWLRRYREIPVVTLSESSKKSLELYGLKKIMVVPVGFDITSILCGELDKEKDPTLIFVGRLATNKRPQDAIAAFEIVKKSFLNSKMWIVGSGPLESKLRQTAPKGVIFLGHVEEVLKQELISKAHILVITSVREGWGMVVSEAARLGTLSIGYDVPGLRDSIRASGGILTDPNPSSLGKDIIDILPSCVKISTRARLDGVLPWSAVAESILKVSIFVDKNINSGFKNYFTKSEIGNSNSSAQYRAASSLSVEDDFSNMENIWLDI